MPLNTFKKWEIYWADLGNYFDNIPVNGKPKVTVGHEQGGKRPVIILNEKQVPEMKMVVIVPCTGETDKELYKGKPCIFLKKEHSGLKEDSIILMPHVKSISVERICSEKTGCVTDDEVKRQVTIVWNNMLS